MFQSILGVSNALVIALVLISLALSVSFWFAFQSKKALDGFTAKSFLAPKKMGPKPMKKESRKELYREHVRFKWTRLYAGFRHLGIIAICGFVVPSIATAEFVLEYPRYGLISAPLIRLDNGPSLIGTPNASDTSSFLLTEFVSGASLGISEVFDWHATPVTHNVRNILIDVIVLGYRTILDAFTLAILYLFVRLLYVATHPTEQEREDIYKMSMAAEMGASTGP
ncbi:MAG: hypothetical protein KGJ79_16160 [Alphaproteobacteria bacterium]|nr:hypothetical protein [Alphaproteobacteria bacterium]MDE2496078.1 hypothetical protein [Alphaproteobacteria bacterium]